MANILFVDDDLELSDLVGVLLGPSHDVVCATGAAAALDRLHERDFDLVILDYSMPAIAGDELGRLIRRMRPALPILGFSAMPRVFVRGVGAWADAYLDKVRISTLPDAVSRLVAA